MFRTLNPTMAVALALGAILSTAPVEAQGKSRKQDRPRAEQQRPERQTRADRERDRDWEDAVRRDDDRWGQDDVWLGGASGNGSGRVPPGWCRGVGNPHNTVENCGYSAARNTTGRTNTGVRGGSYEQAHADFHRQLDARYQRLAAQRPLDVQYQLELRARKRAEHDDWHRRTGIAH